MARPRGSKAPSSDVIASHRAIGSAELARIMEHFKFGPTDVSRMYQVDRAEMTRLRAGTRTIPVRVMFVHATLCKLAGFETQLDLK